MSQYTTLIINSLKTMRDCHPDMSFGEIIYTMLRRENFPDKPEEFKSSWLLTLKDEDIYNAIESAIKLEADELP